MAERVFAKKISATTRLGYWLYLPPAYDPAQPYPLLLFFHGAGEKGSYLDKLKIYGLPKLIAAGQDFPAIVVSPQCPALSNWAYELNKLSRLIDELETLYQVDLDRVYLTGLSMGGYATWLLGQIQPERYAALAPVCGGGDPRHACVLKDVPIWAFHGALDDIVPLSESEAMVEPLRACSGNVQFTVYPDLKHNSWDVTYDNPALFEWIFTQRRGAMGSVSTL